MVSLNAKKENDRELIELALEILSLITPKDIERLTPLEIRILTEFIYLPDKYSFQRFSKYAKKYVIDKIDELYGIKYKATYLNTCIYSLVKKKYLWRDSDDVLYIKSKILSYIKEVLKDKSFSINVSP
jgi:hypothetical protein